MTYLQLFPNDLNCQKLLQARSWGVPILVVDPSGLSNLSFMPFVRNCYLVALYRLINLSILWFLDCLVNNFYPNRQQHCSWLLLQSCSARSCRPQLLLLRYCCYKPIRGLGDQKTHRYMGLLKGRNRKNLRAVTPSSILCATPGPTKRM